VDREAEDALTEGLSDIFPAAVVGEEAAHRDPGMLNLIHRDDPVWIVDPLDGTRNFANGGDAFGTMVAFAVAGVVRAAWVSLPVRGDSFVAQSGSGTFRNGQRLRVPEIGAPELPRGSFFIRFMPAALRLELLRTVKGRYAEAPQAGAAAVEYTDVLEGLKDFVVYFRLLPWDHGAPALILTESGGCVRHADGEPYTLRSPNQPTIVARRPDIAAQVRRWYVT
jgi:fructose-1,6-bisphosphatase/inositol monophosphatase family enzyme